MDTFKSSVSFASLEPLRERLRNHEVYGAVRTIEHMRIFMAHHAYCVWDFMCLLKSLQQIVAPTSCPWIPRENPRVTRFINEIVLAEECDEIPSPDGEQRYLSHFEIYCHAMLEVGADPDEVLTFAGVAYANNVESALSSGIAPDCVRDFIGTTFSFIDSGKSHVIASAFALGREDAVPYMFTSLLREMKVTAEQAPMVHYYLQRHIDIDGDSHGPLAFTLLDSLCNADPVLLDEAEQTAIQALEARIALWDEIYQRLR